MEILASTGCAVPTRVGGCAMRRRGRGQSGLRRIATAHMIQVSGSEWPVRRGGGRARHPPSPLRRTTVVPSCGKTRHDVARMTPTPLVRGPQNAATCRPRPSFHFRPKATGHCAPSRSTLSGSSWRKERPEDRTEPPNGRCQVFSCSKRAGGNSGGNCKRDT